MKPHLTVNGQVGLWGQTYSKPVWCSSILVSSYCSNKEKGRAREREREREKERERERVIESERREMREKVGGREQ